VTSLRGPRWRVQSEGTAPRLREARVALSAQAAVALLCVVLLLDGSVVGTAFAISAAAAVLGHVLLAVLLPRYPTRLRLVALVLS